MFKSVRFVSLMKWLYDWVDDGGFHIIINWWSGPIG